MIDYTNVDYAGYKDMMIKTLQEFLPEYTDTSETDAGIVILEAVARVLDTLSYYQNSQATECYLSTAEIRENMLKWCRMLDYTPKSSTPSIFTQYFEIDADAVANGEIVIPVGQTLRTGEQNVANAIFFTVLNQLTVNANTDFSDKNENYVDTVTVDGKKRYVFKTKIAHGTLIKDECLGNTENVPNQSFTLANSPVALPDYDIDGYALLPRKLAVYADFSYPDGYDSSKDFTLKVGTDPDTAEVWVMKNSFVDSKATDKHYIVEVSQDNTVTVKFGDGISGAIPNGVIWVSYRKGGGTTGNVGAETISVMPSNIRGVVKTYNPDMADVLGVDKESKESIKLNAPNSYRTKWACVEDVDYADKAKELFNRISLCSSLKLTNNSEFFNHPDCFDLSKLASDYPVEAGAKDLTFDQKNYIIDTVQICVLLTGDILATSSENGNKYNKIRDIRRIEDTTDLKNDILESLGERAMLGTHQILTSYTSKTVILHSTLLVRKGFEDKYDEIKKQVSDYIIDYFALGSIKAGATISLNELEADVYADISGIRAFRINGFEYKYIFATDKLNEDGVAEKVSEWYGDGNESGKIFDDLDITSNLWEIIELDEQATTANIKSPTDRG